MSGNGKDAPDQKTMEWYRKNASMIYEAGTLKALQVCLEGLDILTRFSKADHGPGPFVNGASKKLIYD